MLTVYGDVESYYDRKSFTLRSMTPVEYIMSDRWETIGWSVAVGDGPVRWVEGDKLADTLRKIDKPWMFVSHNALFDACVLAYRYNIHPTLIACTLNMARKLLAPVMRGGRYDLGAVARHLNLGDKGKEIDDVNGYRLADLKANPNLYKRFQGYGRNDTELCRGIFKQLSPKLPAAEFVIMDMVFKMATQPQFWVDDQKLRDHKATIMFAKAALLQRFAGDKSLLMSNDKFADVLRELGVAPPTKISAATGEETYAFAKTDEEFLELLDHPNDLVQAAVAARIGTKSTLAETRCDRFLNIASATWDGRHSFMPVPLKYGGPHTHRFSGDWKLNLQNLPSRKDTTLRQALIAPEGKRVVTADAAQIEARLTAWLADERGLLDTFASGGDPYSTFASRIYGFEVTKKMKPQRFLGKVSILGLGFGMGAPKFYHTVLVQAPDAGITIGDGEGELRFTAETAAEVVSKYRSTYTRIMQAHWRLDRMIERMHAGTAAGVEFGPFTFENNAILLPSANLRIYYEDLRRIGGSWTYAYGVGRKFIYGGKMLENMVQWLDRMHVMDAAIRIRRRARADLGMDLKLAHQVHDELVYVVPEAQVEDVKRIALEEMRRPSVWGVGLPLNAEAGSGNNYGEAK
jgi:DNA polymerase